MFAGNKKETGKKRNFSSFLFLYYFPHQQVNIIYLFMRVKAGSFSGEKGQSPHPETVLFLFSISAG